MNDILYFSHLFKPYKSWLLSGIFCALLTALASISLLTLAGWFITSAAIAGITTLDVMAVSFNFMQPAAEIRALAIIRTLGRYSERLLTHEATFRVLAEIRCWFFEKLIPLTPGRLAIRRSADLLTQITTDIDALDSIYLRIFLPIIVIFIAGLAVVVFFTSYSITLGLVMLAMLIVSVVILPWGFNYLGKQGAKTIAEQFSFFKSEQVELIQGIADLQVFGAYSRSKQHLLALSKQMIKTQRHNNHLSALSSSITEFLSYSTLLIIVIIGADLFQHGIISGPVLVMLGFCVLAVFELVSPISIAMQLLAKTQTSAKRIRAIVEQDSAIIEPKSPLSVPASAGIEIKDLSFRYSEKSDWVLTDFNLHIQHGSKIAIVGESGAGKTTLLQLIMRFFDPQKGSINYGGVDYNQFNSDQLIQQYALLSQQTQLFSATVKDNLLIAKVNASEMELAKAIEEAGLNKFIRQLPQGLNSWVGEGGAKVSAGEARRIALARVYLKNAPILLLDEPTEGLDSETENTVLDALEKIAKDKTLILVTHRPAALRLVNKVVRI